MDVLAGLLAIAFMAVTATGGLLLPLALPVRRVDGLALALLNVWSAAVWLLVSSAQLEVQVLVAVTPSHGLTLTDLFALGPLGVAGWLLLRAGLRPASSD